MFKNKLFILSIVPMLVSTACYSFDYSSKEIVINEKSKDHAALEKIFVIDEKTSFKDPLVINELTILSKNKDNISHVYYDKFNISPFGLTINNQASAELIINEVVSNNITALRGDLSIKGNMAKVIIANPNGIDCIEYLFSGLDNIDLITGNSVSLYSQEFKLSDKGRVSFNNLINADTKQLANGIAIPTNFYNLRLISNNIEHTSGSLNASNIDMFSGLDVFSLTDKDKNIFNKQGSIKLYGHELNTRDLVIKGGLGNIEIADRYELSALRWRAYTKQDIKSVSLYPKEEKGDIRINHASNIYRVLDSDYAPTASQFDANNYTVNKIHSVDNGSILFNVTKLLEINSEIYLDNAYMTAFTKNIKIKDLDLNYAAVDLDATNKLNIVSGISGIGYVKARAVAGNFNKPSKINVISGDENNEVKSYYLYKNGKKVKVLLGEKDVQEQEEITFSLNSNNIH